MNEPILDDDLIRSEGDFNHVQFAGFWIRVGASLIDLLILIPVYILGIYNSLNFKSFLLMLIVAAIGAIYKPYLEWKKSATFGKMAVGIKVVDESLHNISGEQAIKRYFPWIISVMISLAMNIMIFTDPQFERIDNFMQLGLLTQESPLNTLNTIYSFVFIGLVGSLIFDSRKQGYHDKFAETYCIVSK